MELSLLVFLAVKNVIYYDDTAFTYGSLKNENYQTMNRDYKTSLENIFAPLNEAIHRLSDSNKIETRCEVLPPMTEDGIITIPNDMKIKSIVNVYEPVVGDYNHIPYTKMGRNKIIIQDKRFIDKKKKIYIEYREDIKHFSIEDIQNGNDVNLEDYGISETMCSYIMEFCKGRLLETLDPSMAAYHNNLAEQYIGGLDTPPTNFNQKRIVNKWGIF